MIKTLKHIEWKTLLIWVIATIVILIALVCIASLIADMILFAKHDVPYTFSLFSKEDWGFLSFSIDPKVDSSSLHDASKYFYMTWFPIISVLLCVFSFLVGGYITGKIAKDRIVLHGIIAGAVIAVMFLSWFTPIAIASAYGGAVLAKRRKVSRELNDNK